MGRRAATVSLDALGLVAVCIWLCGCGRAPQQEGARGGEATVAAPEPAAASPSRDTAAGRGDAGSSGDAQPAATVVDAPPPPRTEPASAPRAARYLVADHRAAAAFDRIPERFVRAAISRLRLFYGHTSHGSHILRGMEVLRREDSRFAFGEGAGELFIEPFRGDLGREGATRWVDQTREVLQRSDHGFNLIMWSWCGGVSRNTAAGVDSYLRAMGQLEAAHPQITFIYMTGHLDGSGSSGNLRARNDQIRRHCRDRGRVLFDFADIEAHDPAGVHHPDASDRCEWCPRYCESHRCPPERDCPCPHSHCLSCYQKGRAFWWLLARLAGWDGAGEGAHP